MGKSSFLLHSVDIWSHKFEYANNMNLGFVVPCIFKYSIKQLTRCTINLIFIALSRRHRSTCFGHCCAHHHQEPPPSAFAASDYRKIAGLDVHMMMMMGITVPETC
jgi:hypothetical protein